jgi:hypothetical protein
MEDSEDSCDEGEEEVKADVNMEETGQDVA